MKLRPIIRSEAQAAVCLLAEGFPVHSRKVWEDSTCRLFAHAERDWDGSIGHIAAAGGRDIGIGLAIPGLRSAYAPEPRKVVNLAAFYLRRGNEWMTTLFLRRMMKDPSVEYVDLTASPAMREVNRHIGFADRSCGVNIVPTTLAAFRPAPGVRVIPFGDLPHEGLSAGDRDLLERHAQFQAIALAVELDGVLHPIILVKAYRKRMSGARVVLARDEALLNRAAGPLSRHLLAQGLLFFEFDSRAPSPMIEAIFTKRAPLVQSTRAAESGVIDHTFSELMFIPPVVAPPLLEWRRGGSTMVPPLPFSLMDASIAAMPTAGLALGLAELLPI